MLLTQEPQVQFGFSEEFFLDVTEVYQRRWLEQSGQWLENVDRTHLVLGSGKPELQNKFKGPEPLLKLFPISKQKSRFLILRNRLFFKPRIKIWHAFDDVMKKRES